MSQTQPWELMQPSPGLISTQHRIVSPTLILLATAAFFLGSYFPWQPVELSKFNGWFNSQQTVELEKGTWILIVEESADRSKFPWLASVLSDRNYWDTLTAKGMVWQVYDDESPSIAPYLPEAIKAGLPALMVVSPTGKIRLAKSCPPTTASIDDALRAIR